MTIKHHEHCVLLHLKQIILKKMEEILPNLIQLFNIFIKFMPLTAVNTEFKLQRS